ncbi:MAG: DUF5057 domain-containing protein [Blautia sp.]|nr:DUF5057 domain-containing protein [Lachnoclostridium sp.]MCM1210395.1 DUF5057 domain-containing protein [Blautia sp.]
MRKTIKSIAEKCVNGKNTKYTKRFAAAAVAILLAASVVITSIYNRSEAAENKETLMGIEKLRNNFSSEEKAYTILEIVPDRSAAEIGYFFEGYEPALSDWDADKQEWVSWQQRLFDQTDLDGRKAFIAGKKANLKKYYEKMGMLEAGKNVPVTWDEGEYEESMVPSPGYVGIKSPDYERTGYFAYGSSGLDKYHVSFILATNWSPNVVNYAAYEVQPLKDLSLETLDGGTPIYYSPVSDYQGTDTEFTYVDTWENLKDEINVNSNTSGGDKKKDDESDKKEDGSEEDGDGEGKEDGTGDDEKKDDEGGETDDGDDGKKDDEGGGTDDGDDGNKDDGGSGEDDQKKDDNTNDDNSGDGDAGNGSESGGVVSQSSWTKFVKTMTNEQPQAESETGEGKDDSESGSGGGTEGGGTQPGGSESGGGTGTEGGGGESGAGTGTEDGGGDPGGGTGSNDPGAGTGGDGTGGDGDETEGGDGDETDDKGENKPDQPDPTPKPTPNPPTPTPGPGDGTEDGDNDGEEDDDEENLDPDEEEKEDGEEDEEEKADEEGKKKGNQKAQNTAITNDIKNYYVVKFKRVKGSDWENKTATYPLYTASNIVASEHGEYSFIKEEGEDTQKYTFPDKMLYCKGVFQNNEWFKKYVLNMSEENFENFHVKVITLTPSELNAMSEEDLPAFDFLYLNSGTRKDIITVSEIQYKAAAAEPDGTDGGKSDGTDKTEEDSKEDKEPDDTENPDEEDKETDDTDTPDEEGGNPDDTQEPGDDTEKTDEDDNAGQTPDDSGEGNGGSEKTPDDGGSQTPDDTNGNDGGQTSGSTDQGTGNTETSGNTGSTNAGKNNSSNLLNTSGWMAYISQTESGQSTETGKSLTDDKQDATGDKKDSTEDKKDAADDKKDSADDKKDAADDKKDSTEDKKDSADDKQDTTDDKKDSADDKQDTTDDKKDSADDKQDTTDDKKDTPDKEQDSEENKDPAKGEEGEPGEEDTSEEGEPDEEDPSDEDKSDEEDTDSKEETEKKDKASLIGTYGLARESQELNDSVKNYIFERTVARKLPCLVDGAILFEKDADSGKIEWKVMEDGETIGYTNIYMLALMMCQPSLENDLTGVGKENLQKSIVEDADKNFTTDQVYCRFGYSRSVTTSDGNGGTTESTIMDSIINDSFFQPTIYKEGTDMEEGYQNVLDEIQLENLYREADTSGSFKALSTNISQAEALRHILNYQSSRRADAKKSIKVLEIQPALTSKPELTKEQIQKWAPGVEEVETTIMTTAEFIGKIDKINEIYDLIYLGTSKEHLNLSNWITDTGKSKNGQYLGSTVFNDSDMDGLIYYNVGDKRVVNLTMSGLLDSEYKNGRTWFYNFVRYGGNDITKEKKDALLSFLNGSYPVIVSDEFMEQPVTLFETTKFSGRRGTLDVGEYTQKDLENLQIYAGTGDKGISSLKVKQGYRITVFSGTNFDGQKYTFEAKDKSLEVPVFSVNHEYLNKQSLNNNCQSVIVEKIEDSNPVKAIDGDHIDNSSYIYEFVNTALKKKYMNFYVKGDIDETGSELFKFYLNRPKASLVDFTANGMQESTTGNTAPINDVYYIYPNSAGRYTLQYNFTIKNEGAASMDTRYYCKLYIDVNADGKFSDSEEVTDIVMLNRQTGGGVSPDELYAGVAYSITREVPSGYKGLLPWKIEVCQINNTNIYASMQGYTKLNGLDRETLKICQINKNGSDVISLKHEVETKGRHFNTLIYGGTYNGVNYPGITDDFLIDVTTINISEFEREYNRNHDYLKQYNMLILGFSDMYGDFSGDNQTGPMSAIVEFINSGKSVLLAHDTTSFFNNPVVDGQELGYPWRNNLKALRSYSNDTRNAATLNKYIRPLVGMDRYGVQSVSAVKRGVTLHEGDAGWDELMSSGKEVAYKPKSGRTETVPEAHGYTYALVSAKDRKAERESVSDIEFTKWNLYESNYGNYDNVAFTNRYVNQRFDDCYYWENWDGKDNGQLDNVNNGEVYNVHVTQVNKGQITEYPYKLQEEFEVAQTHSQYYQLDYTADDDGDGQSDLVVWYCLGGRTSPTGHSDWTTTIYSQSPNDVRNNYYIYNKGNITYTGMGHARKLNDYNAYYTFEEAKLFINTIIASYQAGVKPPSITVLEDGREDAAQLKTLYRYYDEGNMIDLSLNAATESYENLYFTVRDLNFVKGTRMIASHVYYQTDSGSEVINVDGEEVRVNKFEDYIFNALDNSPVSAGELASGGIYYIQVPKSVLSDCENGLDIYFEAQSTITTNTTTQNVYVTDKVYAKLQVFRAYLFDLD